MTWTESWNTVELGEISTGIKTWEIFVFSGCLIYSPFSGFGSWPVSVQRLMTSFLFLFLQWPRCNIRADRISRIYSNTWVGEILWKKNSFRLAGTWWTQYTMSSFINGLIWHSKVLQFLFAISIVSQSWDTRKKIWQTFLKHIWVFLTFDPCSLSKIKPIFSTQNRCNRCNNQIITLYSVS